MIVKIFFSVYVAEIMTGSNSTRRITETFGGHIEAGLNAIVRPLLQATVTGFFKGLHIDRLGLVLPVIPTKAQWVLIVWIVSKDEVIVSHGHVFKADVFSGCLGSRSSFCFSYSGRKNNRF